jgi:hypothetical protein
VSRSLARIAAVADCRVTGLSPQVLAELVAELGPRRDARLADRPRRRAGGPLHGMGRGLPRTKIT